MSRIIIVNKDDEVIDYKERNVVLDSDIYRVSSLWIENSKGEVLLAQRSLNKRNDPGKWGPAVAGTVEEGETYESNIIKEMEEELGLSNTPVEFVSKRLSDGKHKFFSQRYKTLIDIEINELKIQEEEVEEVKWFKKEELKKLLQDKPEMFIPSMPHAVKELLD